MTYESPRPPVEIPDVSFVELVLSRAGRPPDRAAFREEPPTSGSGRILRRELVEEERAGAEPEPGSGAGEGR